MSVRETYRIIECTKLSELNALSDNSKELYKILVSAKVLNLDEGSVAHTILWNMFPEETETGAKIRDYRNALAPGPEPEPA